MKHVIPWFVWTAFVSPALAQVKVSQLPSAATLAGSELVPIVQSGVTSTTTPAAISAYDRSQLITGTPAAGHCAAWLSATVLEDAGAACGSGSGGGTPGGSSGQIQYNNAGSFGGLAVTGSGAVVESTSPTLVTPALGTPTALVLTNATGLPNASVIGLGSFATQNYATPPAIGGTTPAAGTFSALTDTAMTGSGNCVQETSGVLSSTGAPCAGSGGSGANPTGAVGLTAVNGTATTFLRSDGAPALGSQGANTLIANVSGAAAAPTYASLPSCSGIGNYLEYVSGTGLKCVVNAAPLAAKPAGAINTTSTTLVMAGIGGTLAFTPTGTGRIQVVITGDAYTSTAASGVNLQMMEGAGSAPSCCATASTGVQYASALVARTAASGAGSGVPFTFTYILTGLTLNTAIWFDLAFDATAGADAANLSNLSATIVEF